MKRREFLGTAGLAKECRCEKTYESLEEQVKDPKIEAVFLATDAPQHARHAVLALEHGKHVLTAYIWVTGKRLESVSCMGFRGESSEYRPGGNTVRQSVRGKRVETGRVFGERLKIPQYGP